MQKTIWCAAAVLALSAAAVPAGADFHPICTGVATGYANVGMEATVDGYSLEYSGIVNCPDSVVTITALELWYLGGSEASLVASAAGEPCEATVTAPCTLEGSTVASPGSYEVRMLFDADDVSTDKLDYPDVPREARFQWSGVGQPVPTCTSIGFFPVYTPTC